MKMLRQIFCLGTVLLVLVHAPVIAHGFQEESLSATALTHYTMGLIYDMNGLSEQAINEYKQVIAESPDNYNVHLKLGANYARTGQLNEAILALKKVSQLNIEDLQAHYLLALIYSTKKDYDLAAEEYEFILKSFTKSDPNNVEVFGYLGQLYYSQKKYSKAIEQFEKILAVEPKNAEVMYILGSLYLEVDQKSKAIDMFSQSIVVDPFHDGSLNSLGYIYSEDGIQLDQALDYVERAVKIDPDNGAYLDSLGWVYYKKGMYQEALSYLQKADDKLKDPMIYNHIGEVYYKLNKFDDAKHYWHSSLELLPDQTEILEKLKQLPADTNTKSAKQRK